MRVFVACEFSQVVCVEFRKKGHEAFSCDILPCEGDHPEWHIQDDCLKYLNDGWDLMIAHPPCTRLCNSGVMWLEKRNLWEDMRIGAEFFKKLLDADVPMKAIENPIPHKYALEIIGRKYDQIIQPWQFGHGETKKTGFWLYGLEALKPTDIVEGREQKIWKMPPSDDRGKLRSKTYPGIAKAIAEQWAGNGW